MADRIAVMRRRPRSRSSARPRSLPSPGIAVRRRLHGRRQRRCRVRVARRGRHASSRRPAPRRCCRWDGRVHLAAAARGRSTPISAPPRPGCCPTAPSRRHARRCRGRIAQRELPGRRLALRRRRRRRSACPRRRRRREFGEARRSRVRGAAHRRCTCSRRDAASLTDKEHRHATVR